jgi:alkanesulfonate monooxygenase SsuD/methylene tetrahydromethanopterin reductase-like flavin-dependent oxidoreductase (luciferase family)
MLDQMSGGRLELGFGRGASPIEQSFFGQDPATAQDVYAEGVEVVLRGLAQETLDFRGRHFSFEDIPMAVPPVQRPHPPMWYGVHAPESAARAARKGFNTISLDNAAETRRLTDAYTAAWREGCGDAPLPLMGISYFITVAEREDEALAAARRAYPVWHASFNCLFRRRGSAPRHQRPPDFDTMVQEGRAVAGTPDRVTAFLEQAAAEAGVNYLVGQFAFGDLTPAECGRTVDLFARHVMPALKNR